ncbi:MAG: SatD family protein [Bacteroidales bacterium]|nr:SatD family protein [Bacteroidales bacterium]
MQTKNIHAVITGDIIGSSAIDGNFHEALHTIASDINEHYSGFLFEVFRGDSFQALSRQPEDALLLSVIIRAGLRRYSRSSSVNDAWDARISIGIGPAEIKNDVNLGEMTGEAFAHSGQSLDKMKNEGSRLKITTGDKQTDKEFGASCPLADTIMSRWTTSQSEAIYLYLLKKKTQKEIGRVLNTTQRAISKRFESANLQSMTKFFNRYREVIQCKFNN